MISNVSRSDTRTHRLESVRVQSTKEVISEEDLEFESLISKTVQATSPQDKILIPESSPLSKVLGVFFDRAQRSSFKAVKESPLGIYQSISPEEQISFLEALGLLLLKQKRFLPNVFMRTLNRFGYSGKKIIEELAVRYIEENGLKQAYETLQKIRLIVSDVVERANKNFLLERGFGDGTKMEQFALPFHVKFLDVQESLYSQDEEINRGWQFPSSRCTLGGFSMYCSRNYIEIFSPFGSVKVAKGEGFFYDVSVISIAEALVKRLRCTFQGFSAFGGEKGGFDVYPIASNFDQGHTGYRLHRLTMSILSFGSCRDWTLVPFESSNGLRPNVTYKRSCEFNQKPLIRVKDLTNRVGTQNLILMQSMRISSGCWSVYEIRGFEGGSLPRPIYFEDLEGSFSNEFQYLHRAADFWVGSLSQLVKVLVKQQEEHGHKGRGF